MLGYVRKMGEAELEFFRARIRVMISIVMPEFESRDKQIWISDFETDFVALLAATTSTIAPDGKLVG